MPSTAIDAPSSSRINVNCWLTQIMVPSLRRIWRSTDADGPPDPKRRSISPDVFACDERPPGRIVVELVGRVPDDRDRRRTHVFEVRLRNERDAEDEVSRVLGEEPEATLTRAEGLDGCVPLADVLGDAENPYRLAVLVVLRFSPHVQPLDRAVVADDPVFDLVRQVLVEREHHRDSTCS